MKKILFCTLIVWSVIVTAAMTSCNVTRVVTNESSYFTKGDTTVTITVKTVETYDASKKGL